MFKSINNKNVYISKYKKITSTSLILDLFSSEACGSQDDSLQFVDSLGQQAGLQGGEVAVGDVQAEEAAAAQGQGQEQHLQLLYCHGAVHRRQPLQSARRVEKLDGIV